MTMKRNMMLILFVACIIAASLALGGSLGRASDDKRATKWTTIAAPFRVVDSHGNAMLEVQEQTSDGGRSTANVLTLYGAGGKIAAKLTADASGEPSSLLLYGGTAKPTVEIQGYADGGHVCLFGRKGFPGTLLAGNLINVLSDDGVNSMLLGFAGGVPQVDLMDPSSGSRAALFATPERAWLELRRKRGRPSISIVAGKSPTIGASDGKRTTSLNLAESSAMTKKAPGGQNR